MGGAARQGWRVGIVLAATAMLIPMRGAGFPALRLLVPGDADHVATGGSDLFLNFEAEPERLFRPARLEGLTQRRLSSRIENELLLEIRADRFSGSRAGDRRLSLYGYTPLKVDQVKLGIAASYRQESALARLLDRTRGFELEMAEDRGVAALAIGARLSEWVSAGATVEYARDAGLGYVAELRAHIDPLLSASFRHGLRRARYMLAAPVLTARSLELPAMSYDLHQARGLNEVLVELGSEERGMIRASYDFAVPHRAYGELISPAKPLVVRVAFERASFAFDDYVRAEGVATLGSARLEIVRDRAIVGADWTSGIGIFRARYVHGTLESGARVRELGNAAAQALAEADIELNVFANSTYTVGTHQFVLGYERDAKGRFDWSLGVQLLHVRASGELNYGVPGLDLADSEPLAFVRGYLAAVTGGAKLRIGERLHLRYAIAQFVPLWFASPGSDQPPSPPRPPTVGPPPPPGPAPGPPAAPAEGPGLWTRVRKALSAYSGGNLQVFEIVHEF